jgi:psp operon transcriptional activator
MQDVIRSESVPLIGEAPAFLAMLEHVSKAAPLAKPVLVVGERGTGKELIASRLHYLSERWDQPLVKVNCAALTESLLESELFGHEAGAFTGANRTHIGRFEQADGGTLVLDELATISLRMQEKILRVIEYGELQRVGGKDTLRADVRIVGATNEDLPALARRHRFRADLLDRLAFDVIHVPPLRERSEDIDRLAYHFAVNVTSELKRSLFPGFSAAAVRALNSHAWPGNVRELKNTVERSVYRAAEPERKIAEIVFDPFASPFAPPPVTPREDEPSPKASAAAAQAPSAGKLPADFKAAVDAYEKNLLQGALERSQFKQTAAAKALGLTYHQLRGLLRKHGLPRDERAGARRSGGADARTRTGADDAAC